MYFTDHTKSYANHFKILNSDSCYKRETPSETSPVIVTIVNILQSDCKVIINNYENNSVHMNGTIQFPSATPYIISFS